MKHAKNNLIIAYEDYDTLTGYLKALQLAGNFDHKSAELLQGELRKAQLVKKNDIPVDVVRLDSKVTVKMGAKDKFMELMLVLPEKANIKDKKISVFAPIGTALVGFREGEQVKWDVPAGRQTFTIVKVTNTNA